MVEEAPAGSSSCIELVTAEFRRLSVALLVAAVIIYASVDLIVLLMITGQGRAVVRVKVAVRLCVVDVWMRVGLGVAVVMSSRRSCLELMRGRGGDDLVPVTLGLAGNEAVLILRALARDWAARRQGDLDFAATATATAAAVVGVAGSRRVARGGRGARGR